MSAALGRTGFSGPPRFFLLEIHIKSLCDFIANAAGPVSFDEESPQA